MSDKRPCWTITKKRLLGRSNLFCEQLSYHIGSKQERLRIIGLGTFEARGLQFSNTELRLTAAAAKQFDPRYAQRLADAFGRVEVWKRGRVHPSFVFENSGVDDSLRERAHDRRFRPIPPRQVPVAPEQEEPVTEDARFLGEWAAKCFPCR